jgi:hypothetical protein
MSIEWPEQTRLVPIASKSVVISILVTKGEGEDAVTERIDQRIVSRPPTGNMSNVEMKLPSTKLTIQADACPSEDGTGNVQATGQKVVDIPESQTVTVGITMVTRIQQVKMTPNPDGTSMVVGNGASVDASAESDGNVLVVTSPSKWTWTSSDPAILSVSQSGSRATVMAVKEGSVTLTATEEESHRYKSAVIVVKAKEENASLPNGRFEGLVTYSIVTSNGTTTRREKEAITIEANYLSHFLVVGPGYPDNYIAGLNQAVTTRQSDGSISFSAEGYTDGYGLLRGDYTVISGSYKDGTLAVTIKYFVGDKPSQWSSGSGDLHPPSG